MINIRPDEISSIIREQIEQYDQDVKPGRLRFSPCRAAAARCF